MLPTLLAGLLLAEHPEVPVVKEVLPALARGEVSVAVGYPLDGPVLGAGATSHLLVPVEGGWALLDSGVEVLARTPVDFSCPVGEIRINHSAITPDRLVPLELDRVRDTAALLYAVQAAGVAGWCLRTASAYATVRRQFGKPIGAFQAVKHLCAGMLCRAERAAATAWDAACAYSPRSSRRLTADSAPLRPLAADPRHEFPLAAAVAAAVALDAAVENAKDCVQVLGGIGFTWEHDAHLYLRRALALRALLGEPARWRERVARLVLAGARRTVAPPVPSDPAVSERVAAIAALPADRRREALAESGYLTPDWPPPYGLGAGPAEQLLIDAELDRAGVVRPDIDIAGWAVPTILHHGTPAQRDRFAGPSLGGELTWCQLFSEPEAGSDLASLRTRAQRVPGGWVLSGQKVWTSLAGTADWGICLARSDPDAPKHKGLTYFLVDMHAVGVTVRPLRELTGRSVFAEVFLDGVFVPDDCVVGAPGDGWRLARGTLAFERVAIGRGSSLGEDVERLIEAVREPDPLVLERLGGLVADGLAVSLLQLRRTLRRLSGQEDPAGAAVAKLVGVWQRQAVAETALLLRGAEGSTVDGPNQDPVYQFLLTRCLSIAGGTTQILLTMVAERVLGLPRE